MRRERNAQPRGAPRGTGIAARLVAGCIGLLAVVASATFCSSVGSARSATCGLLGVPGAMARRRQRKARLVTDLWSPLRRTHSHRAPSKDNKIAPPRRQRPEGARSPAWGKG
ncbi:hypothetical protein pneo_cds_559 [Pandoravirus neocaledonia]|uniref:Uncharacterized protein n=1 Tax=Pandoravirus neocaledonia TaxID=2107708 RepID=A0A2U7UCK0_9VIRU|nr:hypothetical protein pneo_cds_559 [Pandoravirus neocaledonia]AVK76166.1 hypothetical protein pneo_cds_559 [Pandoravirus neocaledonia]